MARRRLLHPEFFTDGILLSLSPLHRLLFAGLWTVADREGRLKDNPADLKVMLLPADECDVNVLLDDLAAHGRLVRYRVEGRRYIALPRWHDYQKPHVREVASTIPEPTEVVPKHDLGSAEASPRSPVSVPVSVSVSVPTTTTAVAPKSRPPQKSNGKIEFDGLNFQGLTEEQELRWQDAYPAVPIPPAIAQAAAWLKANPANRKSNYERFLVNWFKRDQDKAGRVKR